MAEVKIVISIVVSASGGGDNSPAISVHVLHGGKDMQNLNFMTNKIKLFLV